VAIITTEVWIDVSDIQVIADLSSKGNAGCFESAAIVESMGNAMESLNL
jgi:hypothetical protein